MTEHRWLVTDKGDQDARRLADEHYSRQRRGAPQFTRNGQNLVFITPDLRAAWVTHRPAPGVAERPDKLQAWECTLFRNTGPTRSSLLIREAVLLTAALWGEFPPDGLITHVDPSKVRGEIPGYCFRRAGWRHVGTSGHGALMRFRAPRPSWRAWAWRGDRGGKLRLALDGPLQGALPFDCHASATTCNIVNGEPV